MSIKDCELVSKYFHEMGRDAVVAGLAELRRLNLFDQMKAVQSYLDLAESLGREPRLDETAADAGVTVETVETALLLFKNLLSEVPDEPC